MPKPFNRIASLLLAKSAIDLELKDSDLPADEHDLDNGQVEINFPEKCSVVRDKGTEGDGTNAEDAPPPPPLEVTRDALLLFLERSEIPTGAKTQTKWAECLRDSIKGMKGTLSQDAISALAVVQAEQPAPPPAEKVITKTQAKRNGTKEVVISVRRLKSGKKSKAVKKAASAR